MAKDRRNKVRPQINLEELGLSSGDERPAERPPERTRTERSGSASGSGPAKGTGTKHNSEAKKPKKKKKLSRAAVIIRCVLAVLVVAVVVFVCVLGNYIYHAIFIDEGEKIPSIPPTDYDTTPVEHQSQVAYYLLGLLGEEDTSSMDMLAVVCFDKAQKTVNILQIPTLTVISSEDEWIVDTAGAIWPNPKPFDWCETCRKRVYAPEINEGETPTHTVCGGEITSKTGSSANSLVDFVNDQLSLPIDEFFVVPRKGLSLMIDCVGGVDVDLPSDVTLDGTAFTAGVHTLSGGQATDYVSWMDGTLDRDLLRITRQRQVFGALLARIFRLDKEVLQNDVVEEVMDSSYPVRTDCSVEDMVDILSSMASLGTDKITFYRLPGEGTWNAQGNNVFSVHREELVALLGSAFNPYGEAVTAEDIALPELANSSVADLQQAALSACIPDQTGMLLDAEE